jgi:Concanavalin A-like lectin/glucanases superfamily
MKNVSKTKTAFLLAIILIASSCKKTKKDDETALPPPPPLVGGYANAGEVAASNLVAHFPFDGSIADSKGSVTGGTANGTTSFVSGKKGQAYKGSSNGFLSYGNPGGVATLTSFTVSMWINTERHDGGAQSLFMLSKQDSSFWGNFFMLIEGQNPATPQNMFMKLHFEKNNADFKEHWIEPFDSILRPADMYSAWRHVAWTYDQNTSKVTWYINGQKRALPAAMELRKADAAGTLLGGLNFKAATKFVIGGFQNNLGAPYNIPEVWMLNYAGMLDEFRIYNKALSETEVSALQTLENQGR